MCDLLVLKTELKSSIKFKIQESGNVSIREYKNPVVRFLNFSVLKIVLNSMHSEAVQAKTGDAR